MIRIASLTTTLAAPVDDKGQILRCPFTKSEYEKSLKPLGGSTFKVLMRMGEDPSRLVVMGDDWVDGPAPEIIAQMDISESKVWAFDPMECRASIITAAGGFDDLPSGVSPLSMDYFMKSGKAAARWKSARHELVLPIFYDNVWTPEDAIHNSCSQSVLFSALALNGKATLAGVRADRKRLWSGVLSSLDEARGSGLVSQAIRPERKEKSWQALVSLQGADGDERLVLASEVVIDGGVPVGVRRRQDAAGTFLRGLRVGGRPDISQAGNLIEAQALLVFEGVCERVPIGDARIRHLMFFDSKNSFGDVPVIVSDSAMTASFSEMIAQRNALWGGNGRLSWDEDHGHAAFWWFSFGILHFVRLVRSLRMAGPTEAIIKELKAFGFEPTVQESDSA